MSVVELFSYQLTQLWRARVISNCLSRFFFVILPLTRYNTRLAILWIVFHNIIQIKTKRKGIRTTHTKKIKGITNVSMQHEEN